MIATKFLGPDYEEHESQPPHRLIPFRVLTVEDCPEALALYNQYCENFLLYKEYSLEEFKHWFLPLKGVLYSYRNDYEPLDCIITIYELDTKALHASSCIKTAYIFNYAIKEHVNIVEVVASLINILKASEFDLLNVLSNDQSLKFAKELGFIEGDGKLDYYIYNWKTEFIPAAKNKITMI